MSMHVDKILIPYYLKVLKEEEEQALKGESVFADHNGLVYLSEAIEKYEESVETGFDHTELRWQVWNAVSTLTPSVLELPDLSEENRGKIIKLFWTTNFMNAISEIQRLDDGSVQASAERIAQWLKYILSI